MEGFSKTLVPMTAVVAMTVTTLLKLTILAVVIVLCEETGKLRLTFQSCLGIKTRCVSCQGHQNMLPIHLSIYS